MGVKRKVWRVKGREQFELFVERRSEEKATKAKNGKWFVDPDPQGIYIGDQPLEKYLQDLYGKQSPIELRRILRSLDWTAFEDAYARRGRSAYAPQLMMSLILYGLMQGQTSLRSLERLSRMDVGAMWLCGGASPDHSNIGRFIQRHAKTLTEEFMEQLTAKLVRFIGHLSTEVAGDGTVVEAMCSKLKTLKIDAAREYAEEMRQQAKEAEQKALQAERKAQTLRERFIQQETHRSPETTAEIETEEPSEKAERIEERIAEETVERADREAKKERVQAKKAGKKAQMFQKAVEILEQRKAAKKAKGKKDQHIKINPIEPEAVVQKTKKNFSSPSYKPSVLANADRIITGYAVDPTLENAVVSEMLEQHKRITGQMPETLMLDAGYFCDASILLALEKEINLLCPEGKARGSWKKVSSKKFPKGKFTYESTSDTYLCPAGKRLTLFETSKGSPSWKAYRRYGGKDCASCKFREQCTTSPAGRTLRRYDGDEAKEALRQVMEQRKARKHYQKRSAMVEPVFAALRNQQALTKFRRKGLAAVRVEFALHVMAHNLRRAMEITGRREKQLIFA